MELALDLGLESVQHNAKRNGTPIVSAAKRPAAPTHSGRRQWQQRRMYRRAPYSAVVIGFEHSSINESEFAARPPIEIPDALIFPVCVFCGYGRSYEAEFGAFSRMSCEAELYCHDGCAIEDLLLDERGGD